MRMLRGELLLISRQETSPTIQMVCKKLRKNILLCNELAARRLKKQAPCYGEIGTYMVAV